MMTETDLAAYGGVRSGGDTRGREALFVWVGSVMERRLIGRLGAGRATLRR
jgi:hypothetical protein